MAGARPGEPPPLVSRGRRPLTRPRRTFGFFLRFFLATRGKVERRGRRAPRIRLPRLHHPWTHVEAAETFSSQSLQGERGIPGEHSKEATAI